MLYRQKNKYLIEMVVIECYEVIDYTYLFKDK